MTAAHRIYAPKQQQGRELHYELEDSPHPNSTNGSDTHPLGYKVTPQSTSFQAMKVY